MTCCPTGLTPRWFEEDTFDKDFQEMLEQYQIDESFLGESDGSQANADRPAVSMATSISLAAWKKPDEADGDAPDGATSRPVPPSSPVHDQQPQQPQQQQQQQQEEPAPAVAVNGTPQRPGDADRALEAANKVVDGLTHALCGDIDTPPPSALANRITPAALLTRDVKGAKSVAKRLMDSLEKLANGPMPPATTALPFLGLGLRDEAAGDVGQAAAPPAVPQTLPGYAMDFATQMPMSPESAATVPFPSAPTPPTTAKDKSGLWLLHPLGAISSMFKRSVAPAGNVVTGAAAGGRTDPPPQPLGHTSLAEEEPVRSAAPVLVPVADEGPTDMDVDDHVQEAQGNEAAGEAHAPREIPDSEPEALLAGPLGSNSPRDAAVEGAPVPAPAAAGAAALDEGSLPATQAIFHVPAEEEEEEEEEAIAEEEAMAAPVADLFQLTHISPTPAEEAAPPAEDQGVPETEPEVAEAQQQQPQVEVAAAIKELTQPTVLPFTQDPRIAFETQEDLEALATLAALAAHEEEEEEEEREDERPMAPDSAEEAAKETTEPPVTKTAAPKKTSTKRGSKKDVARRDSISPRPGAAPKPRAKRALPAADVMDSGFPGIVHVKRRAGGVHPTRITSHVPEAPMHAAPAHAVAVAAPGETYPVPSVRTRQDRLGAVDTKSRRPLSAAVLAARHRIQSLYQERQASGGMPAPVRAAATPHILAPHHLVAHRAVVGGTPLAFGGSPQMNSGGNPLVQRLLAFSSRFAGKVYQGIAQPAMPPPAFGGQPVSYGAWTAQHQAQQPYY